MDAKLVVREHSFSSSILRMIVTKRWHKFIKQVLFVFILIFFAYMMIRDLNDWQDTLEDIGSECVIPRLNPYSPESILKYKARQNVPEISCYGEDWVRCYHSKCKVVENRLNIMSDITCTYNDILYISDHKYVIGLPTDVKDDGVYRLIHSDHVRVNCTGIFHEGVAWNWTYYCAGFREVVPLKTESFKRENKLNVLILMFDSTSRIGFIRNLPKTYDYLVKILNGTVLNGYNIVGDGTSGALFPILTGYNAYELPDVRKYPNNNRTLDHHPFIFFKLKDEGYRTAYLEDMPWIGTFQFKYNGFLHQPTDHYLRSFFMEEAVANYRAWLPHGTDRYCVGDTPQYQLMLNLTDQFLLLDGSRFCHTVISDLSHNHLGMLSLADDSVLKFLETLKNRDQFRDTLVLVMADHGPRFMKYRDTLEGRLEERLPFVCVILPEELKRRRPDALVALEVNANRWTTPFDVHTTILDALDLPQYMNPYRVPGANTLRAMSFLRPLPENRSCWDAGIEPSWCTCLSWGNLSKDNPFYQKVATYVLRYINLLTNGVRDKCALRTITAIDWVRRQQPKKQMMESSSDLKFAEHSYQVRIVSAPGEAIYEASLKYVFRRKRFLLDARQILRIDSYANESKCIRNERPNLNTLCYCIKHGL